MLAHAFRASTEKPIDRNPITRSSRPYVQPSAHFSARSTPTNAPTTFDTQNECGLADDGNATN